MSEAYSSLVFNIIVLFNFRLGIRQRYGMESYYRNIPFAQEQNANQHISSCAAISINIAYIANKSVQISSEKIRHAIFDQVNAK